MKKQNQIAKIEPDQSATLVKYQIVQASSFCLPFTLVDVGVEPMACVAIAILCCAVLPPASLMLMRRPWSDTISVAIMSTVGGTILAVLMASMIRPDQLIYGGMLKHHIPLTLPIMFLLIIVLAVPALVQILWDFNAPPKSLPPPRPELIEEHES